jgi:ABC-2 type transport system ATP-binding protein
MTEPQPIVRVRGLSKHFGRRQVLKGLSFEIPPGRIYGLVGHNGAGKTTTLNAVLGLIDHEGDVEVLGLDPFRQRAELMERVAFVSDVASLPRYLKVRELLALVSDIHPRFSRAKAMSFLEGTDIELGQKIEKLSKGMIAQLHLAVAVAIDARLLVLDEPTLGLDILYRKRFYRQLLDDYMNDERTIVIGTHQLDEVETILSDIIFLRDGRLLLDATLEEVSERFVQLLADKASLADAEALAPIWRDTRLGQSWFIFDGVPQSKLAPLGQTSTPTLTDLFVALMQRPAAREATT